MKLTHGIAVTAALTVVSSMTLLAGTTAAHAQAQTPPAAATAAAAPAVAPGAYKSIPALRVEKKPAFEVAQQLSRLSGATVLLTGNVIMTPVTMNTIGGTVDTVVKQFAAALPPGTIIRAAFVPGPVNGETPSGDMVATYLRATDALQAPPPPTPQGIAARGMTPPPPAPDPAPFAPGIWEVLGQRLPTEKAIAASTGLSLRPVYLVTLPHAKNDPVAVMGQMQADSMRMMLSMTPDQRTAVFQQQMNSLMSMSSADRQAILGQFMGQGASMIQYMQAMPPEQRQQFMTDVQAAMKSAGIPMPGAGGAAPRPPAPTP